MCHLGQYLSKPFNVLGHEGRRSSPYWIEDDLFWDCS